MATIQRAFRLANPRPKRKLQNSKRRNPKRRMTLKQKLFFGSKAQRSAAQRNLGHKKRTVKRKRTVIAKHRRRKNVGQILLASNPGRRKRKTRVKRILHAIITNVTKKRKHNVTKSKSKGRTENPSMAKRRRRASTHKRRVTRRRARTSNPVRHHRRRTRRANSPKVVVRYRNSRHSRRRRNSGRRRNPGLSMVGGELKSTAALLGGAYVTGKVMAYVPATFSSGIIGYIVTGIVAYMQGKLLGKVFKSPSLGSDMAKGGFVYLGLKMASDFGLGANLPFGLQGMRGMGMITPSSFYTPQVPVRGSMGSFMIPPAVGAALPVVTSGMHGLTRNAVGGGRMGQRRIGRMS